MGRYTGNFDWITGLLLLCLGSFGLFLLLTLGVGVFFQQLIYLVLGFILLFVCSQIDTDLLWWFAPIAYVIGNIFLALSYLGPTIRGATRWIVLGNIQLQPSELAKPLFLLAFAHFIAKYNPRTMRFLPIHMVLFFIPFLLIFKQPDLGSSLVYSSFWIAMLLAGGMPVFFVVAVGGLGALFLPALWSVILPYQRARIITFLNPALDPKGAGYNALQAMIAVGSGQLFGRGLGRGTQSHLRFLPEHHTDFIFATLVEELGFIGGVLLFAVYALLLVKILLPFFKGTHQEIRVFVYSLGLFAMLFSQIFINTGMNMGLIPVTGITLPFVSYGGSSILSLAIAFGFLLALQQGKHDDQGIAIR